MDKTEAEWDKRIGTGNWNAFPHQLLDKVIDVSKDWRDQLIDIERPWLCWCVDPEWCLLQQKLVREVGWTPVVGVDKVGVAPKLLPETVFVDFNKPFQFECMWMHFPLEFAYLFSQRLAFWHSDVLPPLSVMQKLASDFSTIKMDEYVGTVRKPDNKQVVKRVMHSFRRMQLGNLLHVLDQRWFEVVGCTSQGASRSQFEAGVGFWRHIESHPNNQARWLTRPHYDHGIGIWYWQKYHGGKAREISIDIEPYHYTTKGKHRVLANGTVNKKAAIAQKYDLNAIASQLGL